MEDKDMTTPQLEEVKESQVEDNTQSEPNADEYDKAWEETDTNTIPNDEPTTTGSNEDKEPSEDNEPEPEPKETGVLITKPLKYKGREITVSSEDEAITLMQKGLDYEFKMSKIKPYRKTIKLIEDSNITDEDIQALIDAKNGKKEALEYIANKYNLPLTGSNKSDEDELDLFDDTKDDKQESNYKPEVKQDSESDIEEYFKEYSSNHPKEAGKVIEIYNQLEPSFQLEVTYNTKVFDAFIKDIESGLFEQVLPEVVKAKALNPSISWLQAYGGVVRNIFKPQEQKEPTSKTTKGKTKQRKATRNVDDYDSVWENDKEFEKFKQGLF